jgi:hypothetical protein
MVLSPVFDYHPRSVGVKQFVATNHAPAGHFGVRRFHRRFGIFTVRKGRKIPKRR